MDFPSVTVARMACAPPRFMSSSATFCFPRPKDFVSVSKVWKCKDVPLGGVVKTESKVGGKVYGTEITGFGRKAAKP